MVAQVDRKELWAAYKRNPTREIRDSLIVIYLPIVRYHAERIHVRLPLEVELDDLLSAGLFGLMDAIEQFDVTRGNKFVTYSVPRVRGAILDELRAMDWVPRLARRRQTIVEGVKTRIRDAKGREPSPEEVAEQTSHLTFEGTRVPRLSSLSRKLFEKDTGSRFDVVDLIVDKMAIQPVDAVVNCEWWDRMTAGLNRSETLLVRLYYREEMTMKEIGGVLGLSESRVSQMHSSILGRLKARETAKGR